MGGNGHHVHSVIHQSSFSLWRKTQAISSIPPLLISLFTCVITLPISLSPICLMSTTIYSPAEHFSFSHSYFFSKIIPLYPGVNCSHDSASSSLKKKKKRKKQLESATKDLIQGTGMFGVSFVKPGVKINYQYIELEAQYFNIRFGLSVFTYLLSIYLIIFCRKGVL